MAYMYTILKFVFIFEICSSYRIIILASVRRWKCLTENVERKATKLLIINFRAMPVCLLCSALLLNKSISVFVQLIDHLYKWRCQETKWITAFQLCTHLPILPSFLRALHSHKRAVFGFGKWPYPITVLRTSQQKRLENQEFLEQKKEKEEVRQHHWLRWARTALPQSSAWVGSAGCPPMSCPSPPPARTSYWTNT